MGFIGVHETPLESETEREREAVTSGREANERGKEKMKKKEDKKQNAFGGVVTYYLTLVQ